MGIGILRDKGRKQIDINNKRVKSMVYADVCVDVFTVVYKSIHTSVNLQWYMCLGCCKPAKLMR